MKLSQCLILMLMPIQKIGIQWIERISVVKNQMNIKIMKLGHLEEIQISLIKIKKKEGRKKEERIK